MPYILGGFGLALLAVLAALPVAAAIDPLAYPDIRLVCRALGEAGPACASGALEAGFVSAAGLGVAAVVAIGLRPLPQAAPTREIRHDVVLPLALAAVGVLVLAAELTAPSAPFVSREQEITAHASLVSIVNLGWPLLLQLAAVSRRFEVRLGYLAALATLLCLSPFRAALVSVAAFGVILPLVEVMLRQATFNLRRVALGAGAVAFVGAVLAAIILSQTAERTLTSMDSAQESSPVTSTSGKLAQRVSYPLYQAHFASAVAAIEKLPGALDEIAAKFRLGASPSLNHYLFQKIYNRDTVGEMTSLYYGEAAARSSLPPLFWVVAGPLLYVLAWLLFLRLGADVGVLAGIAIWRGSLGGAFSVLPAFVIQAVVVLVLVRLGRRGQEPAGLQAAPR